MQAFGEFLAPLLIRLPRVPFSPLVEMHVALLLSMGMQANARTISSQESEGKFNSVHIVPDAEQCF